MHIAKCLFSGTHASTEQISDPVISLFCWMRSNLFSENADSVLCLMNIPYLCCFQIQIIDRNCEIPHEGPFCDLMWSDPEEIDTWAASPRGAGWLFGTRVTQEVFFSFVITVYSWFCLLLGLFSMQFNHINKIELVCRAHQPVQEGLKYMFDRGLVTVSYQFTTSLVDLHQNAVPHAH